jgi:nitrate/nitrite-specific signal transduction histidine kinase
MCVRVITIAKNKHILIPTNPMIFKTAITCIILLMTWNGLPAQNLRLADVWHLQKGDFKKDSIQKILAKNRLNLKYNEIVIIQFKGSDNQSFTYQYRIPQADKFAQWHEIGTEPIVQISTLDGGKYSLEISTKEANGKVLFTLPINVSQVFWQEWWFLPSMVFYVLTLIGIGAYFFSVYNLRQKIKVEEIRNRIAADLHDEVGSNLNSIAIFVELLRKKSPKELNPILDRITSNSTESVQLMQDTIWAIQAKNDDFQKFMLKMKGFATQILGAKDISLSFDNQVVSTKNLFSMEQRKNAYLIFKESINNIVKHAQASNVKVKIWSENNQVMIQIEDNGIGFDTNEIFEGNGLQNFEQRAEECDMKIKIDSEIGKGTNILLSVIIDV